MENTRDARYKAVIKLSRNDARKIIALLNDPPKPNHRWEGQTDWDAYVASMKANKNEWGYCGDFSSGIANHIRSGRYKQFHPHGDDAEAARLYMKKHWEVTVRKNDDGLYELYVRWLG